MFYSVLLVAIYFYFAWCLARIAEDEGKRNPWLAYVPILNIVFLFRLCKMPIWTLLLLLIPYVNIAVLAFTFMRLAELRGRSPFLGLALFIPFLNILIAGILRHKRIIIPERIPTR